jgi:thimet oligopeptidase
MSTPDPLVFPTDHDGWLAFVTERPAAAVALIADIDARLAAIAEAEAVDAAEVVDPERRRHRAAPGDERGLPPQRVAPDEDVRAAAEAEVQRLEALGRSACSGGSCSRRSPCRGGGGDGRPRR